MKMIPKSTTDINYEELKREVEIMERLIQPNISRHFNSFEDANDFYIIVEQMDGGDLRKLLNKERLEEQLLSEL